MALVRYWACEDCKEVFPRSDLKEVRAEQRCFWLDDCPTEVLYEFHCPICGSEFITEAVYCENCGEPCLPEDLVDGWCAVCRKEEK